MLAAVLVIGVSPRIIANPSLDSLYFLPLLAAAYLVLAVLFPSKILGFKGLHFRLTTGEKDSSVWKYFKATLSLSRPLALVLLVYLGAEFAFRTQSYHRALQYERQGNLLFTPVPNQDYVEKISLTPSHINLYGLRGPDLDESDLGKRMVICLGDSITYGYGVAQSATYPAWLQVQLDEHRPGGYKVLNGGVNAYPMTLIREKFLFLWARGLQPNVCIIGFSMNEGWLGNLALSDEDTKAKFERRVSWKNRIRRSAAYNVVMENWSRSYYNKIKVMLVPGTHLNTLDTSEVDDYYGSTLEGMVTEMEQRGVGVIFLVFASWNGELRQYDTAGFARDRFRDFAQGRGIPVIQADKILAGGGQPGDDLSRFFLDHAHMNSVGNREIAVGALPAVLSVTEAAEDPGSPNHD